MKKRANKVFSAVLALLLLSVPAYAEGFTLTAEKPYVSYIEQGGERVAKQIRVDGTLSHGTSEAVTGFLYDSEKKLVDVAHENSDENGGYSLAFTLPEQVKEGEYTVEIGAVNCDNIERRNIQISGMGDQAMITSFSINGQSGKISKGEVTIILKSWTDLEEMVPKFTLSAGASAYVDRQEQVSGVSKVNFTHPVTYTVESEDLQTKKTYRVTVKNPDKTPSGGGGGIGGGGAGGGGGGNSPRPVNPTEPPKETAAPKPTEPGRFSDLGGYEWAKPYIESLGKKGIINGFGDGTFRPGDAVTREQFVQMIVSAMGFTGSEEIAFADVPPEHWAYEAIGTAVENELIRGISATEFGTGLAVTRQDMAVIAYRAVEKSSGLKEKPGLSLDFADSAEIADYAAEAVRYMQWAGVINGVGENRFEPENVTTRAAAAAVISRMME